MWECRPDGDEGWGAGFVTSHPVDFVQDDLWDWLEQERRERQNKIDLEKLQKRSDSGISYSLLINFKEK